MHSPIGVPVRARHCSSHCPHATGSFRKWMRHAICSSRTASLAVKTVSWSHPAGACAAPAAPPYGASQHQAWASSPADGSDGATSRVAVSDAGFRTECGASQMERCPCVVLVLARPLTSLSHRTPRMD